MIDIKAEVEKMILSGESHKHFNFLKPIIEYNNDPKNNLTIAEKFINLIKANTYRTQFRKRKDQKQHKERYKEYLANYHQRKKLGLYEGTFSVLEKTCNRCKQTKHLFDFYRKSNQINGKPQTNSKGRYSLCKECRRQVVKLYAENNPEKIKETQRKQWNKPHNRIGKRLRFKLWRAIRRWHLDKTELALRYVGMTVKELVPYLESKFTEGMNWEEFMKGNIHIDHIIPFCSVDLTKEENRYLVSNYNNLRPMWGTANLQKNGEDRKKSIHRKNLDTSS